MVAVAFVMLNLGAQRLRQAQPDILILIQFKKARYAEFSEHKDFDKLSLTFPYYFNSKSPSC